MYDEDDDPNAPINFHSLMEDTPSDLQFRIGQLEGAIKGALPYFENMTDTAKTYATNLGAIYALGDVARAEEVIKALKQLIGEKE
jgi:hypothetical protein